MIALDGADGARVDGWSADGTLPNLAGLRSHGHATRLSAPAGSTDDSLWASFQYAAGPAEHGRYHWRQRLDSGRMGMAYLDEAGRHSFWETLSNRGARVAVFDVPKCGFPRPINGIHLSDWLVHGRYFNQPRSYPESLAADVVEKFGPAPPSDCSYDSPPPNDDGVKAMVENLRTAIARKTAAGAHYLASESWDLFLIGFKEAHCAGHNLWDLADPRHAGYSAERAARLGEPYRAILTALDASVGDLLAAAGPDAAIAVFSTTEMIPNATLSHLMPEIVNRLNRHLGETLFRRAVHRVWQRVSPARARRRCEILPYNDNSTALRLNATLDEVESLLRELTDVDTGQAVIAAIDRPSVEHAGSRAANLPDLLIHYAPGTFPRAVVSPRLGRIEADRPPVRPGNHGSGGFLILSRAPISGVASMRDFGPLAARVLGLQE